MAIATNDEIWADFEVDGVTVKEPRKQDIRRKMNFIEALAAAAGIGAKPYPTKAAMDADLSQPDGKIGLVYADPVDTNNFPTLFYWNDVGNVWVMGTDRVGAMQNQVSQSTAAVDGLYEATGALRPVAWMDTSSYEVAWLAALTSPSTRFTATPTVNGLTIAATGTMPGVQPIAVRLKQAVIPGRIYYFRAKFTAGTLSASNGVFVGNDSATTGNISTSAQTLVRSGTQLLARLSNGASSDGTRAITPTFSGPTVAVGIDFGILVEVLADFSFLVKIFHDGRQVGTDATVAPAAVNSALMVGAVLSANQTVVIEEVDIRTASGNTLFVHSGVSSSGIGSRGAPLKSLNDINGAIIANGLVGQPVTINCLTDNVYGYLEMRASLSPKWTINGLPGGGTTFNGYNFGEVPVWTVVAGTGGLVWTTPTKRGQEVLSYPNQVFIFGRAWNPRPWYNFLHTALPTVSTANGGVDMAGKTAGAQSSAGGIQYLRLPDGMPSADPNAYPIFIDPAHTNPGDPQYSIIVSRALNILSVNDGRPEVIVNDCTLRWSSAPTFLGGAGFGRFTRCRFEWSGFNSPGVEEQNGLYVYLGCKWKYTDGDGLGRQIRTDVPYQIGSTLITQLINCELSHTGRQEVSPGVFLGGDALSVHIVEDGTARSLQVYMTGCLVHDTWKCGVPCNADLMVIDGCVIERAGTEQIALVGVATASGAGRTQRAFIRNTRIDPQGVGGTGVLNAYVDGMALCETQLDGCWIGTPAGGGAELAVQAAPLTVLGVPQTRDITKNRIVYRNCTTERTSGSVVKSGGGVSGTFVPVAANALT